MSVLEEKRDNPKVLKVLLIEYLYKYEDCILYLKPRVLTVQLKGVLGVPLRLKNLKFVGAK